MQDKENNIEINNIRVLLFRGVAMWRKINGGF
jgi:hypothetical protein